MKKFLSICGILCFVFCIGMPGISFGGKCITAACPVIVTREYVRSYVDGKQCYSCDSDDGAFGNDQECDYGAIVMQKDKYHRGVGLYQCEDVFADAWDKWTDYNPGALCDGAKELAEGDGIKKYYLKDGEATQTVTSGDNEIKLGGHDACYYFDCEDPQNYKLVDGKCVSKNTPVDPPVVDKKSCDGKYDGIPISLVPGYDYSATYNKMTHNQCVQLDANPDSNGTVFVLQCTKEKEDAKFRCCPTKCSGNMTADVASCQCRKPSVVVNESCTKKRKGKPVGVACCNLEDASLAKYDAKANTCTCNNPLAKFEIDQTNGTGKCITNEVIVPQCDGVTAKLDPATNKCVCIIAETLLNADGVSCSCDDTNKKIKNGKCEYTEEYLLSLKVKQIREIRARLDGIRSSLQLSVWKDEEGNFNKARLASDAVALVTLGTVGGVITSTLVKKNQIKKGFEAIQCSIGGNIVANYGDEFVVGPAR